MHTLSDHKTETRRVFELKMLFLGLCVLLGMLLVIRFSSPSRRMNAEGIYSPGPMYGVQRYPRPISEFLQSSNASAEARSSSKSLSSEARSSVRGFRRRSERRAIQINRAHGERDDTDSQKKIPRRSIFLGMLDRTDVCRGEMPVGKMKCESHDT